MQYGILQLERSELHPKWLLNGKILTLLCNCAKNHWESYCIRWLETCMYIFFYSKQFYQSFYSHRCQCNQIPIWCGQCRQSLTASSKHKLLEHSTKTYSPYCQSLQLMIHSGGLRKTSLNMSLRNTTSFLGNIFLIDKMIYCERAQSCVEESK